MVVQKIVNMSTTSVLMVVCTRKDICMFKISEFSDIKNYRFCWWQSASYGYFWHKGIDKINDDCSYRDTSAKLAYTFITSRKDNIVVTHWRILKVFAA